MKHRRRILYIGLTLLLISLSVAMAVFGLGYLQNSDVARFKEQHGIDPHQTVDHFVVGHFKVGISREEVHKTMEGIGPSNFYGYTEDRNRQGHHLESVDLWIGRFKKATYVINYDATGRLSHILSLS